MNLPNLNMTIDDGTGADWSQTLPKSKNKPTDDDDKSVQINNVDPDSTKSDLKEIYLRITSYPKTRQEAEQVLNQYSSILKAISETNDKSELEIFNKNGVKRTARQWHNVAEFSDQFEIYMNKPNKLRNKQAVYWMTFRVHTSTPVKVIRQHEAVSRLLDHSNAVLRFSYWTDQEEDAHTIAAGFLLQYDPKHCPTKQVLREVNQAIHIYTSTPLNKIPHWKPIMNNTAITIKRKNSSHSVL